MQTKSFPANKLTVRNIIGFTLTLLLVLQFLVIPIIPVFTKSNYNLYANYVYAHLIFSYFAITVITSLEIKSLGEFHVDRLSILLLALSCFLRRRLGIPGEIYYLFPIMLFGVTNFLIVICFRSNMIKTSGKAILAGITVSCIILALSTLAESLQIGKWLNSTYSSNLLLKFIRELVFQLSFVVLIEEFVFRGFLAGYLIKFGYSEKASFVIQALLFWAVHYARSDNLITFFISIPLLTLSTTLIVRHFKQVSPSIIIHALINTLVPLFLNIWF